jgi:hypothetical protein
LRRNRNSTQPEAMSVAVSVWTIRAEGGLSAMMNRINLPETWLVPFLTGVESRGYDFSGNPVVW